jgi:hypothetical protein
MSRQSRRRLRADQFLGGYHLGERMEAIRDVRKEKSEEEKTIIDSYNQENPQIKEKSELHIYRKRRLWWGDEDKEKNKKPEQGE